MVKIGQFWLGLYKASGPVNGKKLENLFESEVGAAIVMVMAGLILIFSLLF
jgi:hypothetical protein